MLTCLIYLYMYCLLFALGRVWKVDLAGWDKWAVKILDEICFNLNVRITPSVLRSWIVWACVRWLLDWCILLGASPILVRGRVQIAAFTMQYHISCCMSIRMVSYDFRVFRCKWVIDQCRDTYIRCLFIFR